MVCAKAGSAVWRKENREHYLEGSRIRDRRWKAKNPDHGAEYMRERRKDPAVVEANRLAQRERYRQNREECLQKDREYRIANPEKRKEQRARWWIANPGARNASRMKRHAAKLQATPAWANQQYVALWYEHAKHESARTGLRCEVDHIVPLQGETVCGLHNEFNLQVVTTHVNRTKSNVRWPDMPFTVRG